MRYEKGRCYSGCGCALCKQLCPPCATGIIPCSPMLLLAIESHRNRCKSEPCPPRLVCLFRLLSCRACGG